MMKINSFNNPYYNYKPNNKIAFGLYDEAFKEDVLDKTVKGSKKSPKVADDICFEVDQPTPRKKEMLLEAIKNADEWYMLPLKLLAKDWGLAKD